MAIGELEVAGSCDQGLDDIEDIFTALDVTPKERVNNRVGVTSRNHRKKKDLTGSRALKEALADVQPSVIEPPVSDSIIPGTQTVYVRTWGCTHNNSDSEYMAGQLAAFGYNIVDENKRQSADLWLLNSCTVKNPAEDGFKNAITKARAEGRHVVVAGCVPQGQQKADYLKNISVVGVQQIDRVVEVVEETLKGHTVRLFGQKKSAGKKIGGAALNLPKVRKNPLIEIIAVNTGCLNQCTYCKTKHARGELGSYPPEEIVARAKQSFEEGVVEIWLTSEDTGAYGKDIGVTLPELLWQLVDVIPEGAKMRVGMTNPPYIQEYLPEMAEILNHDRVYSFLHIPVQSGSNKVLNDMKREYTVEDFRHTCDFLKERVPELTVATDLICGFPYETEEDFEESCKLVEDYQFPSLFINQFFPRPGTPAAKMKRVPTDVVKLRTKKVSEIFKSYMPYDYKLGRREKVLITEDAKDKIHFVGHNNSYDQVLVICDASLMGKMVEVEIVECGKHFMKGRVLHDSLVISPTKVKALQKGTVSGVKNMPTQHRPLHRQPAIRLTNWRHMDLYNTIISVGLVVVIALMCMDACRYCARTINQF